MTQRIEHHGLQVAANLNQFIEQEALPGTGLDAASFWQGFSALVHDLAPKNRALLAERDRLQAELDAWHRAHPGPIADPAAYRKFLEDIGYLLPQPAQVRATTENVDTEISQQAGPQLVVPVSNPRYALNAANARWGSLYDALYGTDAIPATPGDDGKGYNPERGRAVIARARAFLDSAAPLAQGSHADATGYTIDNGQLRVTLASGATTLKSPSQLIGYQGPADAPSAVLLRTTACILKSRSTAATPSAPPTPPASRTCCSRPRSPPSWTARIRSRRWTPRTRSISTATGSA